MPQFTRLRALAAAALAALVLATIQPPAPGAAETSPPAAPAASVAPAVIVAPAPSLLPTPVASPVAEPPSPIAVEVPAAASAATAAPTSTAEASATAPGAASARKRVRTAPKADRVIAAAMAERGRPWVYGATGPRAFDCSGLVIYAFRRSGVLAEIGQGRYRGGGAMLRWARAHHLTRTIGHRGDVVVWGSGTHVGIYLGKGRAISTLVSGVRIHGLRVLSTRLTTFISTGLWVPARGQTVAAVAAVAGVAASTTATTPKPATSGAAARGAARAHVVAPRTVTAPRLYLRAAPRLTAGALRVLARGTRLGVLRSAKDGTGRTWYRVVVGARGGWVAGWLTRRAR